MLKKEEMLAKINSTYKGEAITIESIVNQVKFLKVNEISRIFSKMNQRLKIPFICIAIILFGLHFAICFVDPKTKTGYTIIILYYCLFVIFFFGLNIGFLVYGRKIVSVMSRDIAKKVKAVRIRIFLEYYLINFS